jgi:hypothetical protein
MVFLALLLPAMICLSLPGEDAAGVRIASAQSGRTGQSRGGTYTVTVIRSGEGMGTVSLSPEGPSFKKGTIVNLVARPDEASVFSRWQGGGCSGLSPACKISVDSDVTVKATFDLRGFTISAVSGPGGSISPAGAVPVGRGRDMTFKIRALPGNHVSNVMVDGVSRGPIDKYRFTAVTADHSISASFGSVTCNLVVTTTGEGKGTIAVTPQGTAFKPGTIVSLKATPDERSYFATWGGGCFGTSPECTVTLYDNTTVTATFRTKR